MKLQIHQQKNGVPASHIGMSVSPHQSRLIQYAPLAQECGQGAVLATFALKPIVKQRQYSITSLLI